MEKIPIVAELIGGPAGSPTIHRIKPGALYVRKNSFCSELEPQTLLREEIHNITPKLYSCPLVQIVYEFNWKKPASVVIATGKGFIDNIAVECAVIHLVSRHLPNLQKFSGTEGFHPQHRIKIDKTTLQRAPSSVRVEDILPNTVVVFEGIPYRPSSQTYISTVEQPQPSTSNTSSSEAALPIPYILKAADILSNLRNQANHNSENF